MVEIKCTFYVTTSKKYRIMEYFIAELLKKKKKKSIMLTIDCILTKVYVAKTLQFYVLVYKRLMLFTYAKGV